MPSLILLNGPPGIGKSTLAARYAERHPGTLNLDVDRLHGLVGGWQDPGNRTHDVLRPVASAMAATHLQGGRDVVLPQFLGKITEVEDFERVACDHGAAFHEIVLLAAKDEAVSRFERRDDDSEWGRRNRVVVAEMGGAAMLSTWYDQLVQLLALRPSALVVQSETDAVEETYAALVAVLGAARR